MEDKAGLGGEELGSGDGGGAWGGRSSAVSHQAAEAPVEEELAPCAPWEPDLGLLSHAAAVRHFRSALRRLEGRTVDAELIRQACGALGGGAHGGAGDAGKRRSSGSVSAGETRAEGLIRMADFAVYLRSFGTRLTLGLLVAATLLAALLSIADGLYLAHWTSDGPPPTQPHIPGGAPPTLPPIPEGTPPTLPPIPGGGSAGPSQVASLLTYVSLGFAAQLFAAVQTVLLTLCALRASRALHAAVLRAVVGAPMAFFDATPSGNVLNRMLSDMQVRQVKSRGLHAREGTR